MNIRKNIIYGLEKLKTYNSLVLQVDLLEISNIELLIKHLSSINNSISIEIYSSEIDYYYEG